MKIAVIVENDQQFKNFIRRDLSNSGGIAFIRVITTEDIRAHEFTGWLIPGSAIVKENLVEAVKTRIRNV